MINEDINYNAEYQDGIDTLGNYPLDSLLIRTENKSVFEIIRRINKSKPGQPRFILNPDFQRDFVWDNKLQSKLIESCLMRIPLPVFYFAEQENGNIVVVDGQQRLTTFKNYLNGKFTLQGLAKDNPLLGKKFSDLAPKLQNRLEDTQLILYLIDHKVPEQAKLDIFERVNSGRPLTRQQMRNALHNGPATYWLREQSKNIFFLKCTCIDKRISLQKNMFDREAINRFCAFTLLGVGKYNGDMDQFLAETLSYMNKINESELSDLSRKFNNSMKNSYEVFGEKAFQIHIQDENRNKINLGYFDALSVALSNYPHNKIKEKKRNIAAAFRDLRKTKEFARSTTFFMLNADRLSNVRRRFELTEQTITEAVK